MDLVVDDREFMNAANAVMGAVETIQGCMKRYEDLLLRLSQTGIVSEGTGAAVTDLISREKQLVRNMGVAVDGLASTTVNYIADLEEIDGDLY